MYRSNQGFQKRPSGYEAHSQFQAPNNTYQANNFDINLYEDWQDKTVYTINAL